MPGADSAGGCRFSGVIEGAGAAESPLPVRVGARPKPYSLERGKTVTLQVLCSLRQGLRLGIGVSSNGRTLVFGSSYPGSNPGTPASASSAVDAASRPPFSTSIASASERS